MYWVEKSDRVCDRKSHSIGAKVLIDAAQGVPHKQIDFEKSGADFMAMSAHKMMGPTGIGALLVTEEIFQSMRPFMGGGDMIQTVTLKDQHIKTTSIVRGRHS